MIAEKFREIFDSRNLPDAPLEESFSSRKLYLEAKVSWKLQAMSWGKRNPPATKLELAALQDYFCPAPIPEQVLELYRGWNGEEIGGSFKPSHQFLPTSAAIELAGVFRDLSQEGYPLAHGHFLPLFSVDKAEVGIFLNDLNPELPVYFRDVWSIELGLLAPSLSGYLEFLLEANRRGLYQKRKVASADPAKYLKSERGLVLELNPMAQAYPIRRIAGTTSFDIFGRNSWPQTVPREYEEGSVAL